MKRNAKIIAYGRFTTRRKRNVRDGASACQRRKASEHCVRWIHEEKEELSPVANEGVQRFRGGLVLKAHRLLYDSTLGLRVIMKNRQEGVGLPAPATSCESLLRITRA